MVCSVPPQRALWRWLHSNYGGSRSVRPDLSAMRPEPSTMRPEAPATRPEPVEERSSGVDERNRRQRVDGRYGFVPGASLPNGLGRSGVITTPHGLLRTPAFVAVGTKATVKAV